MATYRSTDALNVTDTTTGTQDVRVKRLDLFVQENTNSKIAQHREQNTNVQTA